jgi:hypothetical protein
MFRTQQTQGYSHYFSMSEVSPKTQQHLTKVYTMLLAMTIVCATGMYMNSSFIIGGFFLGLISIALLIFFVVQVVNRNNDELTRMMYLACIAFGLGIHVGPLIHRIMEVEPALLIQALLYTATAFTSFSAISLYSKQRSYLFLGGIIMTLV